MGLVTWHASGRIGAVIAAVSAFVWLFADLHAGHLYEHPAIPFWNTGIRFSFFAIVCYLLAALHRALQHERELARTDSLTGATNARYFKELLGKEIERCSRYGKPFTLAYLDLDNFKQVNDRHGHSVGDRVLGLTAELARRHLRAVDVIARVGGDEFAILMVETDTNAARHALARIQDELRAEMKSNGWPVSFSMGAVTCVDGSCSADELIRQADELMYQVKGAGKNGMRCAVLGRG